MNTQGHTEAFLCGYGCGDIDLGVLNNQFEM
jgi:hypothetical protein